ncbi:SDR family NAD(P)-dependent oxidoreductase [Ravibacter arvi]|uniref:SDR family NAD(P)-dependent oxidoreductase n=1 Tax=Ravibacter arvi TaxID=2051041 RepID=A0ABP8LTN1_9BACT
MQHTIKYFYWISAIFLATGCGTKPIGAGRQAKVAQQVWVVTGASSGLGRGISLQAAAYKARVVLVSRNREELETIAGELQSSGAETMVVPTDIGDSSAVKDLVDRVVREWGRVDVWVNNAGVTVLGDFTKVPLREHARVVDVNLKGTMYGSYFAIQQFQRQGYGKLVNIASAESRLPTAYQASYAATKGALINLGKVIRQELRLSKQSGIRVVSVDPWALNTPIWDNAANYSGHAPRMSPMDRTGKAVNAVMRAGSGNRNRDLKVGWKTHSAYAVHWLFPRISTRIASNIVHRHQMELSPPAEDTSGNLFTPSKNNEVETDVRKRMKEEKKIYKKRKKQAAKK